MRDVDCDYVASAIRVRQKIGKEECRAAVTRAGLDHPMQIVLENAFLVVPHVEGQLERAHAAIVQILPDVSVVVPLEIRSSCGSQVCSSMRRTPAQYIATAVCAVAATATIRTPVVTTTKFRGSPHETC